MTSAAPSSGHQNQQHSIQTGLQNPQQHIPSPPQHLKAMQISAPTHNATETLPLPVSSSGLIDVKKEVGSVDPLVTRVNGDCIMCSKFALYLCSSCQKFWYCSPSCQVILFNKLRRENEIPLSKLQNFNLNISLSIDHPFPRGLISVSRVHRHIVILHATIPTGAYNDVRAEVYIVILQRVFRRCICTNLSHQKHFYRNPQPGSDVRQGPSWIGHVTR